MPVRADASRHIARTLSQGIVLPDKGAPLQMALCDMQMIVVLGGRERTERAWRRLLRSVGLEVIGIWQPPAAKGGGSGDEGIIEAVLEA